AEHLPIEDEWADVVHARFAYFFGPESDQGLTEVARVLAPGGVFIAIDNSWTGGDFAGLLRSATGGNASVDPDATDRWWSERGAVRHELHGGWVARSGEELARILRIEFPDEIVNRFVADRRSSFISYRFALYEWRKPQPVANSGENG
ncbi:MAG: class I SAM-dependent methyltransferase, partial [Actinomycetota bacterium]